MGGGTTDGQNRADQPLSRPVVIGIKSQDGDTAFFRVARDKKIQELLKTYCIGKNFIFRDMEFIHNGGRIRTSKTLIELGIEDGDEIDAMEHQDGGGNLTTFA